MDGEAREHMEIRQRGRPPRIRPARPADGARRGTEVGPAGGLRRYLSGPPLPPRMTPQPQPHDPEVTPALATEHGLTDDEYRQGPGDPGPDADLLRSSACTR